jgi:hypothetical protein
MTAYATTAQIKAGLRIAVTDTIDDTLLGSCGTAASALIDGYVGRTFSTFGTATRYYAADDPWVLQIDDLGGTALTLQTSSSLNNTYDLTWAPTDYQLEPLNGIVDGQSFPYTRIRAIGNYAFPTFASYVGVKLTGVFGFASVPAVVTQACIIQAERLFKRLDSPLGVAGYGDMGVMRVSSKLDADVAMLLAPYVRYRGVA